jgi:hypothetical protein
LYFPPGINIYALTDFKELTEINKRIIGGDKNELINKIWA